MNWSCAKANSRPFARPETMQNEFVAGERTKDKIIILLNWVKSMGAVCAVRCGAVDGCVCGIWRCEHMCHSA